MKEVAYIKPEHVSTLEQAASNPRDKLLIRLLFRLGCRVSEALGLTVDDIDVPNSQVKIKHLKNRINHYCPDCHTLLAAKHSHCSGCGVKITETQKKAITLHKQRIVPIDRETLGRIQEYITASKLKVKNDKQLLFGINRHRAWQIITRCARDAGLPEILNAETGKVHHVSPHRLRDAFAVNAVKHDDSGNGLRQLQQHLGHTNINTTSHYVKVSGEEQKQWYQSLWQPGP